MKKACFIFTFDSVKEAEIIAEALDPEIKNKIPKTKIEVSINDKSFILDIKAKDVSSLRAACNSYLRWINTALSVNNAV